MPDGDRVHSKLSYHYHKVYKQICEGQFASEDLARKVLHGMIKDIQKYGDAPITLLKQATVQIEQLPTDSLFLPTINWNEVNRTLEKLAQQIYGQIRGIDLAVKACKDYLYELRYELQYGNCPSSIFPELTKKYLWNVYRAEFEERVPSVPQHYKGVSKEFVNARLAEMQPYVSQGLEKFVVQIAKRGTVNLLHLPRNTQPKQPIGLHDDLSELVG